jgi:hypothetical protein
LLGWVGHPRGRGRFVDGGAPGPAHEATRALGRSGAEATAALTTSRTQGRLGAARMLEDVGVDRSDPLPNPQLIEQAAPLYW